MKDFDMFEKKLKEQYEQIESPNKQQVIHKISSHKDKKMRRFPMFAMICFGLFLSVATVGAMNFNGLTFFNKDASSVIELETMTDEEMIPHNQANDINMKNRELMDQLRKTIEPGKFLYFLDVEAFEQYGEPDIFSLYNFDTFRSFDNLPVDLTTRWTFPKTLLEQYEFKEGSLIYNTPEKSYEEMMEIIEQLKQQALKQNQHYAVLEGELLSSVHSISLWYETNEFPFSKAFDITIDSINKRLKTSEDLSSFVKLDNVLTTNAYYSEEQRKLVFVQQTPEENYLISIRNPVISEENVSLQTFIEVANMLLTN
ncbi:hypothetical protein NYE67_08105 [Solibacillus sp. FSL W8-0474]|uniref:hypothetical protein n=1 Tax=Solibacillus sp. FSL W8-0474 TaxID=2975336 RepID=UPI0030F5FDD0